MVRFHIPVRQNKTTIAALPNTADEHNNLPQLIALAMDFTESHRAMARDSRKKGGGAMEKRGVSCQERTSGEILRPKQRKSTTINNTRIRWESITRRSRTCSRRRRRPFEEERTSTTRSRSVAALFSHGVRSSMSKHLVLSCLWLLCGCWHGSLAKLKKREICDKEKGNGWRNWEKKVH